jgi:CTP synthase (UTP-ammonia lyase)
VLYGVETAIEDYRCNYGVNSEYHAALEQAGLTLSGFGEDGELRIVEISTHPFFLATLFLPQMRSSFGTPHPLLTGFATAVEAVVANRS